MKKIIFILFCYFFSANTSKPSDYLYDLGASTCISSGTGGKVKGVFGKQLPSLIPADLSMILFTLGPCSLDLPHIHPRASEFIYLINGTLRTSFIDDNGKVITNDLTPGQVTLIPQGLIHDQVSFNF
jgi:oxalate decarboxylase/phosphoglucose isomerase-like protein (cupin superfamily)